MLRGFGDSSKRLLFPAAVTASNADLTRASSVHDGINRLSTLLGAPLGGLLIAGFGTPAVLVLDGVTFLLAAVVIALTQPGFKSAPEEHEPYLPAMRAGLGYLRKDRLVFGILLMLFWTNLFDQAYSTVLAPAWAHAVTGSSVVLGMLFGAFGVGAVLGNVVFTAVAPKAPRYLTFVVGFLVCGAPRFFVMVDNDSQAMLYAVAFVSGLGSAALNPILGAVLYERIPAAMQARVLGLGTGLAWAGIPLGGLLGGWAVGRFGLNAALIGFGALYLLVTLVPLVRRDWRALDDRPAPEPEPESGDGERVREKVLEG